MTAEASTTTTTTYRSLNSEPASPLRGTPDVKPAKATVDIVWINVVVFTVLHLCAVKGFHIVLTGQLHFYTYLWLVALHSLTAVGITAGAHRLWAHRAYKATWQLRTLLMLCQTLSFQNHVFEWVRDHRVHHKFTDTDADPHNSRRGLFFSHIGWLLVRKHEDVRTKGATVDLADLKRDPIVMFQRKYYRYLVVAITFVIPTLVPAMLWGEDVWAAWWACVARYTWALHCTWLTNSVAHAFGTRPFDKSLSAVENWVVAQLAFGEGWHNYHHAFPWDYKTAELGNYKANLTTAFIDFFSRVGWASDLKSVSREMVEQRLRRTGDGSHAAAKHPNGSSFHHHPAGEEVWGWGDRDMAQDDIHSTTITNRSD